MDRISGLMPQIGWSPLLTPAAPRKAPASTVEPAAKSANINSGMGAEVDTQTAQDRAQQVSDLKAQVLAFAPAEQVATTAASVAGVALVAGLMPEDARGSGSIDPDAPTGPPPTFEVTPLEAAAARRLDPPEAVPVETEPVTPPAPEASAEETAAAPVQAAPAPAPAAAPEPAPAQTSAPEPGTSQGDWQRLETGSGEPSLDVTR